MYFRNTDNKNKQTELRERKISLMKQMGDKYFKSDSDQCLPLANQVTYKFSNSISVNISNLIPAIKFKLEHIFTIHLFPLLKVETRQNL